MFIDTHAHLDHGEQPIAEQVDQAVAAGVELLIHSGTDVESSRLAARLADSYPGVFATVGIHPHEAEHMREGDTAVLRELARHPKVLGIGETGLDFYRNLSPVERQEKAFVAQIELARELDLPLVIHTRQADDKCLELLQAHAGGLTVVFHCFSMPDRVQEIAEHGWFLSFAGNVTFKKAEALSRAASLVRNDSLLIETDAPYLTPEPLRGRPNAPANVVHTYRFVADVRGISVEELAHTVLSNACRAFPKLRPYVT